jgi:hypothetical protein
MKHFLVRLVISLEVVLLVMSPKQLRASVPLYVNGISDEYPRRTPSKVSLSLR